MTEQDTLERPTSDLPTPRFRLGDEVWSANTQSVPSRLDCPDCLGTRLWKVTTPGGSELEAECQRCQGYLRISGLPTLDYAQYVPVTRKLTVGQIQVKTPRGGIDGKDDLIQYMATETGIGSGSVYYERLLYASEAEAFAAAQAQADGRNAQEAEKPKRVEQVSLSNLTIRDAAIVAAEAGLREAWYAYRALRSDVEELLEGTETAAEMRDDLTWKLEFDARHRDPTPIQAVVKAARVTLDGASMADLEAAMAALDATVEAMRSDHKARAA